MNAVRTFLGPLWAIRGLTERTDHFYPCEGLVYVLSGRLKILINFHFQVPMQTRRMQGLNAAALQQDLVGLAPVPHYRMARRMWIL